MKYLLIKFLIGGISTVSEVSIQYIVDYDFMIDASWPSSILDRYNNQIYKLDSESKAYSSDTWSNEYSKGWVPEGKKETIALIEEVQDSVFGLCLKVTVSTSTPTYSDYNQRFVIHEFIAYDNPILKGVGTVNDKIDWRIFNNNHFVRKEEFPFKIRQYSLDNEGNKFIIYEVASIEEKMYTEDQLNKIMIFVHPK